ncbi:MAG TPA: hypothetical protein VHA52_12905 [Candidatus Babeliaceae bacterium]|nr:hypothetical protein [Candidatus Babeliaceae bacterium]
MIFKKLALAFLFTYSLSIFSTNFFCLKDQIAQCPKLSEFYDSLSQEEKNEANNLLDQLDTIFNGAMSDFTKALEAHPELVAKFKQETKASRYSFGFDCDETCEDLD